MAYTYYYYGQGGSLTRLTMMDRLTRITRAPSMTIPPRVTRANWMDRKTCPTLLA